MAKFYGAVGYEETSRFNRGVWLPEITERKYFGDILRNISQPQESSVSENDDLRLSNEISIVADAYAYENFSKIRYVEYMNQKWKVSKIEVRRPRLILTIGGVYNTPRIKKSQNSIGGD